MPDVNAMAAQGVAQRMGGPPGGGPPMPGGGPPGMGGGGNPAVEQGRQLLKQLTVLITSDPMVMAELAPDIKGFGSVLKEFAGMAQGGGQPPMGGGPPPGMGGPMGGPPPGGPPPGMGGPPMG